MNIHINTRKRYVEEREDVYMLIISAIYIYIYIYREFDNQSANDVYRENFPHP